MISKKSLKINGVITKLPSWLLSNNVQATMQGGNESRRGFTCLSSGNEVGSQTQMHWAWQSPGKF